MKPANFAPVYACMYPQLAELCRQHGYALAAHGTLGRDFDLIAIPWVDVPYPSDPQMVVNDMCESFSVREVGGPPSLREHGRLVFSLSLSFGECFLDLSFMPRVKVENEQQA